MNSKKNNFLTEAEHLFIDENLSATAIAEKLNLNRKTVNNWRRDFEWDKKRNQAFMSKARFHSELFEFSRKLLNGIMADMDAGEKVDQGRLYTFCKVLPMVAKVKEYEEEILSNKEKQENKGLTPELIAQIEEEVLGIKPTLIDNENK